jgi:hypothetical protein
MLSATMRTGIRTVVLLASLAGCSHLAAAQPQDPGFNELIVLDPGVDENGLPAVQVSESGEVEIPATLHIHPYYYSRDMEYQGPIIQGGPTIVVANHPKTGKKMYIDVTLPAGAPVVAYDKHSITYVYPDQRIIIHFSILLHDHAIVKNVHGRGFRRVVRDSNRKIHEHFREQHRQSRLSKEVRQWARGTGHIAKGAVGVVLTAGAIVVERARAVRQVIPGVQALESIGQQSGERQAVEKVRQAGLKQTQEATKFLPTVR